MSWLSVLKSHDTLMLAGLKMRNIILFIIFMILNLENSVNCVDLTHEEVDQLMLKSETQYFLAGFNSSYQRRVIFQQLKACPYTPLCTFSLGIELPMNKISCCQKCKCKFPECLKKNTCCPDIIFLNNRETNSTITTFDYLEELTETGMRKTCISLHLSQKNATDYKHGAFGYETCPAGTREDIVQNCTRKYSTNITSFDDITPVLVASELYRNKYCALCHNTSGVKLKFLKHKFSCELFLEKSPEDDTGIINEVLNRNVCDLEFIDKTNKRLDLCYTAVTKCESLNDSQKNDACSLYRSVMTEIGQTSVEETSTYKVQNPNCLECNGIKNYQVLCDIDQNRDPKGTFAFSGLLKQENVKTENTGSNDRCSENEIYDSIWVRIDFMNFISFFKM
jgi:hypothetical protein